MHRVIEGLATLAMVLLCVGVGASSISDSTAPGEGTPSQAAAQATQSQQGPHVYHLTAIRAVPGRASELLKLLSAPPSAGQPAGDFAVVFRHREGHEWDFLLIEHMGATATVSVGPQPQADSPFSQIAAWHGDTYAAGPPLDEFRRALNLTGAPTTGQSSSRAIYAISDYMTAPGHRSQLRQQLDQIASQTPGRSVTLTHVEGAPWTFLAITRYDSWRQFADEQDAEDAEAMKDTQSKGPGLLLREHMAMHHDTLANVAAVVGSGAPR
jgi:hypothetical protein